MLPQEVEQAEPQPDAERTVPDQHSPANVVTGPALGTTAQVEPVAKARTSMEEVPL